MQTTVRPSRNLKLKHRTYESISCLGNTIDQTRQSMVLPGQRPDLISEFDMGVSRDYATQQNSKKTLFVARPQFAGRFYDPK